MKEEEVLASGELSTLHKFILDKEITYVRKVFIEASGNLSKAAKIAGMTRDGMYRLIRRHGLTPKSLRPCRHTDASSEKSHDNCTD